MFCFLRLSRFFLQEEEKGGSSPSVFFSRRVYEAVFVHSFFCFFAHFFFSFGAAKIHSEGPQIAIERLLTVKPEEIREVVFKYFLLEFSQQEPHENEAEEASSLRKKSHS